MLEEPQDPFNEEIAETLRFCLHQHWKQEHVDRLIELAADCARVDQMHLRVVSNDPRAIMFGGVWVYEEDGDGRVLRRTWDGQDDRFYASAIELGAFGDMSDAGYWGGVPSNADEEAPDE